MSETRAATLLGNLWYMIAQRLFDKVCTVTELDAERIDALRQIALRPMDFEAIAVEPADGLAEALRSGYAGIAASGRPPAAASPSGIE